MIRLVANGSVNIDAELQRLRNSGVPSVQSHRADSSSQLLRGDLLEVGQWYGTRMIVFIAPGYEVFFIEGNKLLAQSERYMALDRMYSEINHRIEVARWMVSAYRTGFEFALEFTTAGRYFNTAINLAFALAFYSNNKVRINRVAPQIPSFLRATVNFFVSHPNTARVVLKGAASAKVRELQVFIGMLEGSGANRKRVEALVKLLIGIVKLEMAVRERRTADGLENTFKSVLIIAKGEMMKRLKDVATALRGNIATCLEGLRAFKLKVSGSIRSRLHYNIELVEPMMRHPGMVAEARRIIASNSSINASNNPDTNRIVAIIRETAQTSHSEPIAILEYINLFSEIKVKLSTCTPTNPEDTIIFTPQNYHDIANDLIDSVGSGASSLDEFIRQSNYIIPQLQTLSRDFNSLRRSYNWGQETATT